MSRKAREKDETDWKTATCYAVVGDYGPFKFRGPAPVGDDDAVTLILTSSAFANDTKEELLGGLEQRSRAEAKAW